MKENLSKDNKSEKGLSISECIVKADEYIRTNGQCLFLFDVAGSKKYDRVQRHDLQERLLEAIEKMNTKFDQYFPTNYLNALVREEKGFYSLLGDGSWAGINSSEVISQITDYLKENYSDIKFHFDVARDGCDTEALELIQ